MKPFIARVTHMSSTFQKRVVFKCICVCVLFMRLKFCDQLTIDIIKFATFSTMMIAFNGRFHSFAEFQSVANGFFVFTSKCGKSSLN